MQIKLGKLHLGLVRQGFSIMWMEAEKARGTWFVAISWTNPAFDLGVITSRGFGGYKWRPGKSFYIGVWSL